MRLPAFDRRYILCALALIIFCSPRQELRILIHMMPDQQAYFTSTIIPAFERNYPYTVAVDTYQSTDSIGEALAQRRGAVSVVKIPFDKAQPLMQRGALAQLDTILTPAEASQLDATYLMTSLGSIRGRHCCIPRKFETRIMVYCKSKVADALASWRTFKPAVDSVIRLYNGYGLPATYILETDPEQWNYFDLFMVGWIWSHTPYNGKQCGRLGFRGKRYSGTSQSIYDRIFQLGGDSTALLSMEGDAVVDAVYWEALNTASGICNNRMWKERWSGADIWKAFADGEVFLSFMTQLDCFFLHGTGMDNLNGYLPDPDDMGIATIPRACSVELDSAGIPRHFGSKAIATGGWWWGIPADAPDPHAAYKLISFITSTEIQIQECSRFGMIPVRKDILGDMALIFGGGWISGVYDASFRQLINNSYTILPGNKHFNEINTVYLDLIDDILVEKHWAREGTLPQRAFITERILNAYQPRIDAILKQ